MPRGTSSRCGCRLATKLVADVAAVNGVAYAGGLILALVCDLIVASTAARFCAIQAVRGLTDPYTTSRIAARVGIERAKYLVFTGRPIDAMARSPGGSSRWQVAISVHSVGP